MHLTDVRGIGEATAARLAAVGIETAEDLAAISPHDIPVEGLTPAALERLIWNAREAIAEDEFFAPRPLGVRLGFFTRLLGARARARIFARA